jgi:hypothetical protein
LFHDFKHGEIFRHLFINVLLELIPKGGGREGGMDGTWRAALTAQCLFTSYLYIKVFLNTLYPKGYSNSEQVFYSRVYIWEKSPPPCWGRYRQCHFGGTYETRKRKRGEKRKWEVQR